MDNLKVVVSAEIELQGNIRWLEEEIGTHKTHFLLFSNQYTFVRVNNTRLVPNENNNYYEVIESNLEQGKRFRISVVVEADIMVADKDDFMSWLSFHVSSINGVFKSVEVKIIEIKVNE